MNRNIYDDFYEKPYLVLAPGKVIEKLEPKDNELNRFKAGSDMTFTTWTISNTELNNVVDNTKKYYDICLEIYNFNKEHPTHMKLGYSEYLFSQWLLEAITQYFNCNGRNQTEYDNTCSTLERAELEKAALVIINKSYDTLVNIYKDSTLGEDLLSDSRNKDSTLGEDLLSDLRNKDSTLGEDLLSESRNNDSVKIL